jgi:hypothetical protein
MIHVNIYENELCDMWFIRNGELRALKLYRAKVVDNKDPLKQNRVKVFIPELMKDLSGIWARPLYYFKKTAITPEIGDSVVVFFENGNLQTPVYIGHVRLECYQDTNHPACGKIQAKEQDVQQCPYDFWLLETPNYRRIRLSDSKKTIQIGSYTTKRILELDDQHNIIRIENQNTGRVIQIDDNAQRILIQTPQATVELNDSAGHIQAKIGNSEIQMTSSQITAKNSGSFVQIDSQKVQVKAGVIMLN